MVFVSTPSFNIISALSVLVLLASRLPAMLQYAEATDAALRAALSARLPRSDADRYLLEWAAQEAEARRTDTSG